MRVITWNIRKGRGGYRRVLPEAGGLGSRLAAARPDLVLCQEVFHADGGGAHQDETIARELGMACHYGPNAHYGRGNHGNATLARELAVESYNSDISVNRLERRGVLHSRVRLDGRDLHVFNTHLGLTGGQRRKQVAEIAALIEKRCAPGEPVILGGDFNDWTGKLDRIVRRTCGVAGALQSLPRRARRSWPDVRPTFALDRVYYRDLVLEDARILNALSWRGHSDHLPLVVDLSFPS